MIFLDNRQSKVTLVIILRDELQQDKLAIGELFLKAPRMKRRPLQHESGCFLLLDVPEGKYTIMAGGSQYREESFMIDTRTVNPARPFVELYLNPQARYVFPEGLTVLKGKICDASDSSPVQEAVVLIQGRTEQAVSDDNGGYFILFPEIAPNLDITVSARKTGYETAAEQVVLVKGSTRFLPLRLTRI